MRIEIELNKITLKTLNKLISEQEKLILQSTIKLESLKFTSQSISQYIERTDIVFYEMSLDLKKIIKVNKAAENIWRYPQSKLKKSISTWFNTIHPEDRKAIKKALTNMVEDRKDGLLLEYRLLYDDSSYCHIVDRVMLIRDESGKPKSIMGVASDMSNYLFSKRKLLIYEQILSARAEEKNNNLFFDTVLKIIVTSFDWDFAELWVLDEKKEFFYCTNIWTKNFSQNQKKYIKTYQMKMKITSDFNGYVAMNNQPVVLNDISQQSKYIRLRRASDSNFKSVLGVNVSTGKKLQGQIFLFSEKIKNPVLVDLENIFKTLQIIGPIIQNNSSDKMLIYQSSHDKMTGLLNQSGLETILNEILSDKKQMLLAIIILDIRGIKTFLDLRGEVTSQKLFKKVITHLEACLLPTIKFIAKISETKIALIAENLRNESQIDVIIKLILDAFIKDFNLDGESIMLSANLGISIYPDDGKDSRVLIHKADIACNKAGDLGVNNYQFFKRSLMISMQRAIAIENSLRQAIYENKLQLCYQPKVNLITGKIVGVEALVRLTDPTLGIIYPAEFISIAEQSDLITSLDKWVFLEIMNQYPFAEINIPVSINISARHLAAAYRLVPFLKNLLKKFHVPGRLIDLELTEYQLAQNRAQSVKVFNNLAKENITLSIDDFGIGFSSFEYLKLFRPNTVKIDKSFIDELPHNLENLGIVRAIIALSKSLNIKSVAEGVETKEQLDCLIDERCDEMQGFYFSRPLPIMELKKLVKHHDGLNIGQG